MVRFAASPHESHVRPDGATISELDLAVMLKLLASITSTPPKIRLSVLISCDAEGWANDAWLGVSVLFCRTDQD